MLVFFSAYDAIAGLATGLAMRARPGPRSRAERGIRGRRGLEGLRPRRLRDQDPRRPRHRARPRDADGRRPPTPVGRGPVVLLALASSAALGGQPFPIGTVASDCLLLVHCGPSAAATGTAQTRAAPHLSVPTSSSGFAELDTWSSGQAVQVPREDLDLPRRLSSLGIERGVHREAVDEPVESLGLVADVDPGPGLPCARRASRDSRHRVRTRAWVWSRRGRKLSSTHARVANASQTSKIARVSGSSTRRVRSRCSTVWRISPTRRRLRHEPRPRPRSAAWRR